jgi:hypothetical protein
MDYRWITDDHVHALIEALSLVQEPYRARLREILITVTALHTESLHHTVREATSREDTPFTTAEDVQVIETLLSKGLMHNGVVPTMSIPEIARAADLTAQLITRARIGHLTFDDQELLTWVFDQGANAYEQSNFMLVRHLEHRVRGGLGLEPRIAFLPNLPHDPA